MYQEIVQLIDGAEYEHDLDRKNNLLRRAEAQALQAMGWCPDRAEFYYLHALSWHLRPEQTLEKQQRIDQSLKQALALDPSIDISRFV